MTEQTAVVFSAVRPIDSTGRMSKTASSRQSISGAVPRISPGKFLKMRTVFINRPPEGGRRVGPGLTADLI